jgi:uncharacterized protein (TIGR00369 family)
MLLKRPDVQYLVDMPAEARLVMEGFFHKIPYQERLGLSIVEYGFARARVRLPFSAALIGDRENGFLHGGAITSLIDSASGLAMLLALPAVQRIATLDLRIDYMRPALSRDVVCESECFRLTRQVGFVRSVVSQEGTDDPIACGMGTFMRIAEDLAGRGQDGPR